MYDSGEFDFSFYYDDDSKNDTPKPPNNNTGTFRKRRLSFAVEDETSFAENDSSWLMETASVVENPTVRCYQRTFNKANRAVRPLTATLVQARMLKKL